MYGRPFWTCPHSRSTTVLLDYRRWMSHMCDKGNRALKCLLHYFASCLQSYWQLLLSTCIYCYHCCTVAPSKQFRVQVILVSTNHSQVFRCQNQGWEHLNTLAVWKISKIRVCVIVTYTLFRFLKCPECRVSVETARNRCRYSDVHLRWRCCSWKHWPIVFCNDKEHTSTSVLPNRH